MKSRLQAALAALAALVALLALPLVSLGQQDPSVMVASGAESSAPCCNEAVAVIHQQIDKIEWNEVNFEFVIEWLREQGGGTMNVVAEWSPLAVVGVEAETPVTLSLRNTTVAEVLNETLEQVAPEGTVRFRAIGNTLRISTIADFNRKLFVRVYDVTDLLFKVPDFDDAPEIDLTQVQSYGGGQVVTPPVFTNIGRGGQEEETEEEINQRLEELRLLIEQTLDPIFWDVEGGPGSIRIYNKSLVVRASMEMHEEIAGFFIQ